MADDLVNALAQQHLPTRMSVMDSRVPDEYAIHKALAMLRENNLSTGDIPQTRVVTLPGITKKFQGRALAQTDTRGATPQVSVMRDSSVYKNASKDNPGALTQLAGILAHEYTHVDQGAGHQDESTAYDQQLDVLKRLGATQQQVNDVLKARAFVTKR
jgi:hypothetical protein